VRAVLELAGIRDVLAKSLGTTNPINMAKATVAGLKALRRPEDVAKMRGKTISEILPYRAATSVEPEIEEAPADVVEVAPEAVAPEADAPEAEAAAPVEPELEPAEAVTEAEETAS